MKTTKPTTPMNTSLGATASSLGRYLAALALVVGVGLAGCGGDGTDDEGGSQPGALTAADCASFARGGSVDICHATGATEAPFAALKVTSEACKAAHTGHAEDFVDRDGSGCKLAKPAASCRKSGSSCTLANTEACCSKTCLCGSSGKCRCL